MDQQVLWQHVCCHPYFCCVRYCIVLHTIEKNDRGYLGEYVNTFHSIYNEMRGRIDRKTFHSISCFLEGSCVQEGANHHEDKNPETNF